MLRQNLCTAFVGLVVSASAASVGCQGLPDLSGVWQSKDGEVLFTQSGATVAGSLKSDPACPYGGTRAYFLRGTLERDTLRGTAQLCTHNKQLYEECHLSDPYTAEFEAKVTDGSIRGTYKLDYINYDKKDGHYLNCRITRGGSSDDFEIVRADCCELVKQLQDQVKALQERLDQLEKKLTGSDITLGSGSTTVHVGADGITLNSDGNITIKSGKNVVIKGATVTRN